MRILDPTQAAEIQRLEQANQQVEAALALRLYMFFGSQIRPQLQEISETILDILYSVGFMGNVSQINQFLERFRYLDVLKTYGANFNRLVSNVHNMSPSHCSDMIRLYGEWIEKKPFQGAANEKKEEFRPGLGTGMQSKGAIWQEMRQRMDWGGKKIRKIVANQPAWGGLRPGMGEWQAQAVPQHLRSIRYLSPQAIGNHAGGISLKGVINRSAVGKLDRVFGLLEGADISGTTADSTYVVSSFNVDPIMYLLPLGTLVYNFHHTWLEVALALSINRQKTSIDYYLGFYRTCIPLKPSGGLLAAHRPGLIALMMVAESEFQLILKSYSASGIAWCIHFNPEEKEILRENLNTRTLLNLSSRFSSYPTPGDALRILEGTPLNFKIRNELQIRNLPVA
jgi:hypothetical protein